LSVQTRSEIERLGAELAKRDAVIAEQAELITEIERLGAELAKRDAVIAEQAKLIAELVTKVKALELVLQKQTDTASAWSPASARCSSRISSTA